MKKQKSLAQLGVWVVLAVLTLAACGKKGEAAWDSNQDRKVMIQSLEKELRAQNGKLVDYDRGRLIIEQYREYARSLPMDSLAPIFLFRAADVARGITDYGLAIKLWGQVAEQYPQYERAPDALFLQGLTADQDREEKKAAAGYYERFLKKYPDHPLSKDARLLLDYLNQGKSDEELIRDFKDRPAATE